MRKNYFMNCFILVLPILIWNISLTDKLPVNYQQDVFSRGIPAYITLGENVTRIVIFSLAFLMPLNLRSDRQRLGLCIYVIGLLLYFASWSILIIFPNNTWSESMLGFSAPAYTPAIWLLGICLIGDSFYFSLPFRRWPFIALSVAFLAFHISHTILVYNRISV